MMARRIENQVIEYDLTASNQARPVVDDNAVSNINHTDQQELSKPPGARRSHYRIFLAGLCTVFIFINGFMLINSIIGSKEARKDKPTATAGFSQNATSRKDSRKVRRSSFHHKHRRAHRRKRQRRPKRHVVRHYRPARVARPVQIQRSSPIQRTPSRPPISAPSSSSAGDAEFGID